MVWAIIIAVVVGIIDSTIERSSADSVSTFLAVLCVLIFFALPVVMLINSLLEALIVFVFYIAARKISMEYMNAH